MDLHLRLLWCLFLTDAALGGTNSGYVNPYGMSWSKARRECQNVRAGCDLTVQRPAVHRQFWDALPMEDTGTEYWIGARTLGQLQWERSENPLIESLGCYEAPASLKSSVRPLRYNSPSGCFTKCSDNYVALMGTTCYCLSSADMTMFSAKRSESECHIYCKSNPYRCGGDNSRVSIYKLPDRMLLERRGKKTNYFWKWSYNNEKEFILLTNKPGSKKKQFCASTDGTFSTTTLKSTCPTGSQPMSFENVDVLDFLEKTTDMTELETFYFPAPLVFKQQPLWLDGVKAVPSVGSGGCTAVRYDGQNYTLVNKRCREKLPSVCSCYSHTDTTTIDAATTAQPMVQTTQIQKQPTTEEEVQTTEEEIAQTTTEEMAQTTTQKVAPTTTQTVAQTTTQKVAQTTTTEKLAQTTVSDTTVQSSSQKSALTTEDQESEETTENQEATTQTTTVKIMGKTSTATTGSRSESSKTSTHHSDVTSSPTSYPTPSWNLTYIDDEDLDSDDNATLLFPFHAVNASDVMSDDTPVNDPAPPSPSLSEDGGATAGFSTEMIIGIAVGAIAVMICIVVVVVVVKRKQKTSSSTLIEEKDPKRRTKYPDI